MRLRQISILASVSWISWCAGFDARASVASYQDWQFTDSSNPSEPTVISNTAGTATATIVLGYFAVGWLPDGPGTQTGLWDLGGQNPNDPAHDTRGQVQLSIPNPGAAGGNSYTDLGLRVVQYIDQSIYTGFLTSSIPGGVYLGRTIVENTGVFGGKWVEDQFEWHLTPSPTQVFLTITGATNGTLLDRIRVDTLTAVVAPPLMITFVAQQSNSLAISWTGGIPPYQVYATSNLLNNTPWQPVGMPVSATNALIPMEGPVGFIRISGGN